MAILNVNPTRMELNRLKRQLDIARRGHKLLKDKRDELMRQFLEIIRENENLRKKTEALIKESHRNFLLAAAVMERPAVRGALMVSGARATVTLKTENVMNVKTPVFELKDNLVGKQTLYPYGMALTTGELDMSVFALNEVFPLMLDLAQTEKKVILLSDEIEKTSRRVNSLEHIMIPDYEETIKSITMKLDESERGNLTRLMKVKDMIVKQAIEAARNKE